MGFPIILLDYATDLDNPPQFQKRGPMTRRSKSKVRKHFSDLHPLIIENQPAKLVFDNALEIAKKEPRATVTHADESKGIIEVVNKTPKMHYRDDMAIRIVQRDANTVVVDIRSAARIGLSDLKVNYGRINLYMEKISQSVTGRPYAEPKPV